MTLPALTPAQRLRAIVAGSLGNLVEWYDFYIYAFTALYFSAEFFPKGDRTAQLLGTAGIFAAGFLMRPLGGWYFGRLADRRGRRHAMVVAIAMMGAGSLAIALVPTHAAIGAAAPIILLLARMAQGFSTGGEYGTAATYLSEVAATGRRGFQASFQYVTLVGGQLLALLVILLLQTMFADAQLKAWGWRVGFAIGALGALAVLVIRGSLHESAPAEAHPAAGRFAELMRHWRAFLIVMGLTAGGSLIFYVFTTYMQKFLVNTTGFDARTANWVMTPAIVLFAAVQPLFGALSDRIGRRANLVAFGALATLATLPLLRLLGQASTPFAAFALVTTALAINALYTSISGLFKAELFPVHVRALGVGLSYGIANALFGGSAEYVALRFKQAGIESGFYWYVTAICAVSFATALALPRHRHDPMA